MPEPQRSFSFVVRLWLERTASRPLRGQITRVGARGPDEQRAVTELGDVTRFIEDVLEHEGLVKPPARRWRWLSRFRARERR